jgi:two-component system, chemotaxis family, protein-glutamate methylesterase/glutaminase
MPGHDIIVIGASAGGIEALRVLVAGFPHDLQASIFVVLHLSPTGPSVLAEILTQSGLLPGTQVVKGELMAPGHIYVAPPDHHLLVEQGHVRVTRGPKENRFRPSVDVLFRSAAYAYGSRVIGVILTGALDDGTAGLWAVKDRGGLAVVQDPQEARHSSMPQSALRHVSADACLPLAKIAPKLVQLSGEPATAERDHLVSKKLAIEARMAWGNHMLDSGVLELGRPSPYTCPDCHGTLLQLQDGSFPRFRCHTGHAYSPNSLLADVTESLEHSLGNTLRLIDEKVLLLRHLAQHARDRNDVMLAELAEQKARDAEQSSELIREFLIRQETLSEDQLLHNAC